MRVPRPSICTGSAVLAVGRASAIRSSSGASKPVVSTLTLTSARSRAGAEVGNRRVALSPGRRPQHHPGGDAAVCEQIA
jgi:hypothetical protein